MTSITSHTKNVGIVLLAAGASTRLGRPKQLLAYHGQTLLQHSVQTAAASRAQQVMVVLGASSEKLASEMKEANVHVVVNTEWQEGMGSSIRCGINAITGLDSAFEGMIIMVCDQPFVTTDLLNEIIDTHRRTGKQIIACSYEDSFGPPVFFHRSLFKELMQLKGDIGARSILIQHTDTVEVIPFPQGTFDVDTEEDYERLKTNGNQ